MKYDLSKIEERFREKFASPICELNSESELEITEKLFFKPKHLHVPFGFIRYDLILLDERPVLHVRLKTRMDMDGAYLIDDEEIRSYDMHSEKNKRTIRNILFLYLENTQAERATLKISFDFSFTMLTRYQIHADFSFLCNILFSILLRHLCI